MEPDGSDSLSRFSGAGQEIGSGVTWGGRQLLIGFVGAILLIFLLSAVLVGPVVALTSDTSPEFYVASAITTLLWNASYVYLTFWLVRRSGGGWPSLGLRNFRFRPAYIFGGYAVAYGAVLGYGLLAGLSGIDALEPDGQLPEALFDSSVATAMTSVAVIAGAPVAEEILFRGFLFAGLRRRLPFWGAALVSAGVFASAHTDPGLVIPFTAIGVVLAYVYERSGTLATPIAVHLIFNTISFLAVVLFPELREAA